MSKWPPERIQFLAAHGPEYVRTVTEAAALVRDGDPRAAAALELLESGVAVRGGVPRTPFALLQPVLSAYLLVELRARGYTLGWDSAMAAAHLAVLEAPGIQATRVLHARLARMAASLADDLLALELVELANDGLAYG